MTPRETLVALRDALVGKLSDEMDPDNAAEMVAEFEQSVRDEIDAADDEIDKESRS